MTLESFENWTLCLARTRFYLSRGGSRGRVQGVRRPPPPAEMTCGFLIQLVFCPKKKTTMWFISVEVEQETSAPPPKKKPGSAPAFFRWSLKKHCKMAKKLVKMSGCRYVCYHICRRNYSFSLRQNISNLSLKFLRLFRVVFSSTRSNRMNFRLPHSLKLLKYSTKEQPCKRIK